MVATTCTFFPEPEENEEQSLLGLAFVPIYLVHSIKQPFCSNPHCVCQQHRPYTSALLESARLAELTIQRIPGEVEL